MEEKYFFKCRNGIDDILAYATKQDGGWHIRRPVTIYVDTDDEEGKQYVSIKEFLPMLFSSKEDMFLPDSDIMSASPLNESFQEDYIKISDFYYVEMVADRLRDLKKGKSEKEGNVFKFSNKKGTPNPIH
jgi:hypothetical protein